MNASSFIASIVHGGALDSLRGFPDQPAGTLPITSASLHTMQQVALKWAWLFPVTYSFHIAEEYWGGEGFPRWISRVAGAHLTENAFLILNFTGMVFMIAGVVVLKRSVRWRWSLPALGTIVLLNGILHIIGSILTRSYSPGVVTGSLCWIPLGGFTLWFEWRNAPRWAFNTGVLGALCVTVLILFLSRGSA